MSPGVPRMGYSLSPHSIRQSSFKPNDLNCRNKALNAKLLKQGYRNNKLRKTFWNFIATQCVGRKI